MQATQGRQISEVAVLSVAPIVRLATQLPALLPPLLEALFAELARERAITDILLRTSFQ